MFPDENFTLKHTGPGKYEQGCQENLRCPEQNYIWGPYDDSILKQQRLKTGRQYPKVLRINL